MDSGTILNIITTVVSAGSGAYALWSKSRIDRQEAELKQRQLDDDVMAKERQLLREAVQRQFDRQDKEIESNTNRIRQIQEQHRTDLNDLRVEYDQLDKRYEGLHTQYLNLRVQHDDCERKQADSAIKQAQAEETIKRLKGALKELSTKTGYVLGDHELLR